MISHRYNTDYTNPHLYKKAAGVDNSICIYKFTFAGWLLQATSRRMGLEGSVLAFY
jgi:hypothetical protein